jgi:YbbR domain-containing protein
MKDWIFNNFWIKILSLLLAVMTWLYVNGELTKQKRTRDVLYKPPTIEETDDQPSLQPKQINKNYLREKR